MDGLVGGKAGEADGLAKSRRSGAVGGRSSSVRAGQGSANGRGSRFGLHFAAAGENAWALRQPPTHGRLHPFLVVLRIGTAAYIPF